MSSEKENLSPDRNNVTGTAECRACLQKLESKDLYNLFQAWTSTWEGMNSTIAEDLSMLANVELKETDKHSKLICSTCCSNLWNACKFKLLVLANDKILQKRYPQTDNQVSPVKEWPQPIQVEKNIAGLFDSSLQVEIKQEVLTDDETTGNGEEGYTSTNCHDMIKIEPEEIAEPVINATAMFRVTEINGQECLEENDEIPMDSETDRPVHEAKKNASKDNVGAKSKAPLTHDDVMIVVAEALSKPVEDSTPMDSEPDPPIQDEIRGVDASKQDTEIGTKQIVPLTQADVMGAVAEALSKPVEFLQTVKEEPLSEPEDAESATDLPMECLLCARTFNSVSGLKAHVIAQHSYQTVERKTGDSSPHRPPSNKFVCATCRRTFVTSTDLMVHETCHNKLICYGCSAKFDTFDQLTKHRRRCKALSNPGVKRLKTLEDVIRPPQENNRVAEIKIEINDVTTLADSKELSSCPQCHEVFTDPYYLKIHQSVHHIKEEAIDINNGPVPMKMEALESIFKET